MYIHVYIYTHIYRYIAHIYLDQLSRGLGGNHTQVQALLGIGGGDVGRGRVDPEVNIARGQRLG